MTLTVSAHVTVLHEVTVTADTYEEAEEKFKQDLYDKYAWADYDEIHFGIPYDEEEV